MFWQKPARPRVGRWGLRRCETGDSWSASTAVMLAPAKNSGVCVGQQHDLLTSFTCRGWWCPHTLVFPRVMPDHSQLLTAPLLFELHECTVTSFQTRYDLFQTRWLSFFMKWVGLLGRHSHGATRSFINCSRTKPQGVLLPSSNTPILLLFSRQITCCSFVFAWHYLTFFILL